MKKIHYIILFVFAITELLYAQQKVANVNVAQSELSWTGYGAIGNYSLTGDLEIKEGTFYFNEANELQKIRLTMDMKSISHENKTLVKHLKSDDFFEVKKYPTALIEITHVENQKLMGTLTMKGITKPISIPYTLENAVDGPRISGTVTIDRTIYGINYNSTSFFQNLGSNAIKDSFDVTFNIKINELKS